VEPLTVAGRTFQSRLILGTGKYTDLDTMVRSFEATGTEMVTVALRRVNLDERGADAVLMNTAIADAQDPVRMARAMKLAVEAGWLAAHAGRIQRKLYATASSPLEGLLT